MAEELFEIVARTVVEEEFRAQLLAGLAPALDGYDLTSEEKEALAKAASEPLDEFVPLQTIPRGRVPGADPYETAITQGGELSFEFGRSQGKGRVEKAHLVAALLRSLLQVVELEAGGRAVVPDGFRLREDASEAAPASLTRPGMSYQSLQSVRRRTPLIEMIARQLCSLLAAVELMREGQSLALEGFHLKDLADWSYPGDSPDAVLRYLTSSCRMSCRFCYQKGNPPALRQSKRRASKAEVLTRLRYFEEGRELFYQTVFDTDEMLTHPMALEALRRVRARSNALLALTSNGAPLDEAMVRELAALKPVTLAVSINCLEPSLRRGVLRDYDPQMRAVASLRLLAEYEIPFAATLVAWPGIPLEELAATARYADRNQAQMIRVNLPGYTKYFSRQSLFDHDAYWHEVARAVRRWRPGLKTPLLLSPSLYEDNAFGEDGNAVRLLGVVSNSPAQRAGLGWGDELLEINGLKVASRPYAKLLLKLAYRAERVRLKVGRGGKAFEVELPDPGGYPYHHYPGARFGLVIPDGLSPYYMRELAALVRRHRARRTLLLSSPLIHPLLDPHLRRLEGLLPEGAKVWVGVPPCTYMGGSVIMGDLLVVDDFVDYIRGWVAGEGARPDLVVIPSSPFHGDGWLRDLVGVPYLEIERRTGIPVALLSCQPMWM